MYIQIHRKITVNTVVPVENYVGMNSAQAQIHEVTLEVPEILEDILGTLGDGTEVEVATTTVLTDTPDPVVEEINLTGVVAEISAETGLDPDDIMRVLSELVDLNVDLSVAAQAVEEADLFS